jgi:hypothetical protein
MPIPCDEFFLPLQYHSGLHKVEPHQAPNHEVTLWQKPDIQHRYRSFVSLLAGEVPGEAGRRTYYARPAGWVGYSFCYVHQSAIALAAQQTHPNLTGPKLKNDLNNTKTPNNGRNQIKLNRQIPWYPKPSRTKLNQI